ncbi:MAG TPA: zinc-dependent alcohol dehydrogenase [Bryobacteraceae bacterium]|nr:zinc-dependent alcohol dehydrogenase [Bryobacteraceae bacterium]
MKAVCWHGTHNVRVEDVSDARLLNRQDALIKVTLTAICDSDLLLYDGTVPFVNRGDILGHEFMGEVVEVGRDVRRLKAGDRVVVPFIISCGRCFYCQKGLWSLCENASPNAAVPEKMYGSSTAGIFGYSHLFGGFAGGQAQYARVPFADMGAFPVPPELRDEQVLFLSDNLPAGYVAAENCNIQPGDTIAVWGCGAVGQFAIRGAYLLGAGRVIAIDDAPARLEMARSGGAEAVNSSETDLIERLKDLTAGRGPDACIDAVGPDTHGLSGNAVQQAVQACRPGGAISIAALYSGSLDKFPMGAACAKGLVLHMGRAHVPRYMGPLLERIRKGEIDPSFVITHRFPLDRAPEAYRQLRYGRESCIKAVLRPD